MVFKHSRSREVAAGHTIRKRVVNVRFPEPKQANNCAPHLPSSFIPYEQRAELVDVRGAQYPASKIGHPIESRGGGSNAISGVRFQIDGYPSPPLTEELLSLSAGLAATEAQLHPKHDPEQAKKGSHRLRTSSSSPKLNGNKQRIDSKPPPCSTSPSSGAVISANPVIRVDNFRDHPLPSSSISLDREGVLIPEPPGNYHSADPPLPGDTVQIFLQPKTGSERTSATRNRPQLSKKSAFYSSPPVILPGPHNAPPIIPPGVQFPENGYSGKEQYGVHNAAIETAPYEMVHSQNGSLGHKWCQGDGVHLVMLPHNIVHPQTKGRSGHSRHKQRSRINVHILPPINEPLNGAAMKHPITVCICT